MVLSQKKKDEGMRSEILRERCNYSFISKKQDILEIQIYHRKCN